MAEGRNDVGMMWADKREEENIGFGQKRKKVKRRWKSELKATYIN